jgi:hypothetical protein
MVQAHSGCLQVLEQPQGNHWPARNARGAIRATHLGEGEPPARTPRRHRRLTHTEMTQAVASDGRCRSPPVGWLTSPCFVPDMGPVYETMRLTDDDVTGPAPRIGQGHRLVPSPRREARSTQSHAAQHPARICSPDSAKHLNAALRGCISSVHQSCAEPCASGHRRGYSIPLASITPDDRGAPRHPTRPVLSAQIHVVGSGVEPPSDARAPRTRDVHRAVRRSRSAPARLSAQAARKIRAFWPRPSSTVRNRADQAPRPMAHRRARRNRDPALRPLVQPPPPARDQRRHPAHRARTGLDQLGLQNFDI